MCQNRLLIDILHCESVSVRPPGLDCAFPTRLHHNFAPDGHGSSSFALLIVGLDRRRSLPIQCSEFLPSLTPVRRAAGLGNWQPLNLPPSSPCRDEALLITTWKSSISSKSFHETLITMFSLYRRAVSPFARNSKLETGGCVGYGQCSIAGRVKFIDQESCGRLGEMQFVMFRYVDNTITSSYASLIRRA